MGKNLIIPANKDRINALTKWYLMHPMGNTKSSKFFFNGLNLNLLITAEHWIFCLPYTAKQL